VRSCRPGLPGCSGLEVVLMGGTGLSKTSLRSVSARTADSQGNLPLAIFDHSVKRAAPTTRIAMTMPATVPPEAVEAPSLAGTAAEMLPAPPTTLMLLAVGATGERAAADTPAALATAVLIDAKAGADEFRSFTMSCCFDESCSAVVTLPRFTTMSNETPMLPAAARRRR
jgi:hypothetical protein